MQLMVEEMFERLLKRYCSLTQVRAMEQNVRGVQLKNVWNELEAAGLPNALADEQHGGIGLNLSEVVPLFVKMGEHALPLPLAETMVARALLYRAGETPPSEPIILATSISPANAESIETGELPHARTAGFMLLDCGERLDLYSLEDSKLSLPLGRYSLSARVSANTRTVRASIQSHSVSLREIGAFLHAARLAGAMQQILRMTINYAQTRSQFGRPIGKFQAVQHQISVMAEQVAAASMAVELAGATGNLLPDPLSAAVAKECTSAASKVVGPIAHAIHGAIGISAEYDLQLFTRLLHEWRAAEGSESYWAIRIGRSLMESDATRASDFVRNRLAI